MQLQEANYESETIDSEATLRRSWQEYSRSKQLVINWRQERFEQRKRISWILFS